MKCIVFDKAVQTMLLCCLMLWHEGAGRVDCRETLTFTQTAAGCRDEPRSWCQPLMCAHVRWMCASTCWVCLLLWVSGHLCPSCPVSCWLGLPPLLSSAKHKAVVSSQSTCATLDSTHTHTHTGAPTRAHDIPHAGQLLPQSNVSALEA